MSRDATPEPPRLAALVVETLIGDPDVQTATLGDLAEDHAMVAVRDGDAAARRWYWSQVLRSAPWLARESLAAGIAPSVRVLVSVTVGYAVLAVLVFSADLMLMTIVGRDAHGMVLLSVLSLGAGVVSALVAGFVAASLGGRASLLSALALGVLCLILTMLLAAAEQATPVWYRLGLAIIVLPGCCAGALFHAEMRTRLRRRSRPSFPGKPQ